MTPKEIVQSKFPHAEAVYHEPVFALGQKKPYVEGGWSILSAHQHGAQQLGSGSTEEAAWSAAAKGLAEVSVGDKLTFKHWLEVQVIRAGTIQERQKIISDWTSSVDTLCTQMVGWVRGEDPDGIITFERGESSIDEENIGEYSISSMRISLGTRFVDVIPIGRYVVGGIGPSGDIGLRAEGRVDMQSLARKYLLFRAIAPQGHTWKIVDDDQYLVHDLSKDTFIAALQDLLS